MATVEQLQETIDAGIMSRVKKEAPRTYLGASYLGDECKRKIWFMYNFNKAIENPRVHRIFDTGHMFEDYIVRLLRESGLTVHTEMPDGEQYGFEEGKIAGHIDGVIEGIFDYPVLFEGKSAKNSKFNEFKKKGCQATYITYWVQCQIYMHKLGLTKTLFIVMNKDTQDLYFEYIDYNKSSAEFYLRRGHEIAEAEEMPDRAFSSSTFFKCRFCNHNKECWNVD